MVPPRTKIHSQSKLIKLTSQRIWRNRSVLRMSDHRSVPNQQQSCGCIFEIRCNISCGGDLNAMSLESDYLGAFETHSPNEIRAAFAAGASPVEPIKGKRPIDILIEMYTRSPRFAECLRVMLDAGATIDDP